MAEFPRLRTGAVVQYPARRDSEAGTCVVRFVDGSEQRFREQASALRRWTVRLDRLDDGEWARLQEFFRAQQGQFGAFTFRDPWSGADYPNCCFENDTFELELLGAQRARTMLIVRQNRD